MMMIDGGGGIQLREAWFKGSGWCGALHTQTCARVAKRPRARAGDIPLSLFFVVWFFN